MTMKQVWFNLKMLDHLLIHCKQSLFWSSFNSLDTIFAKISSLLKSLLMILQTSFFFMSTWLAIIWAVSKRSPFPTALPARCWPWSLLKAFLSWSHLLLLHTYFWSLCTPKKYVCTTWCYFHTLAEAFQVVFPNSIKYFRFTHCSVFTVHYSVLIAEWAKKEVKVCKKKSNNCRKLRLQLYTPKISC